MIRGRQDWLADASPFLSEGEDKIHYYWMSAALGTQREDKIHSHSFRASWCAPAGPLHNVKETAPWRCIRFIVITPTTSELAVGVITTKRPQLSIVETVSFTFGGEDKIRTCGRITPTAV